jgi:serine/threonine-protein kinase
MIDWRAVREAARGHRSDYKLDSKPLDDSGGQAQVFGAIHQPTGVRVAFKRVRQKLSDDAKARMRREIEVGSSLDHPNVVPVLDGDPAGTWCVMPLAAGNLEKLRPTIATPDQMRRLVDDICAGLAAAHDVGWIHRDIKPSNVLLLENPTRWAVADWGLVRRPRGKTTVRGRTRIGVSYGTEGFAPPELSRDAHEVTAACDVYYVGQLIGWCVTGRWPIQNIPLLPEAGPWRRVVRGATHHDVDRRPQSIEAFLQTVEKAFYQPPEPADQHAERLLDAIASSPLSNAEVVDELLLLAETNSDEYDLCVDVLPKLGRHDLAAGVRRHPERGYALLDVWEPGRVGAGWDHRNFRWADQIVWGVLAIATAAADLEDIPLLEKAAESLFEWDGTWNQWPPQDDIRAWLRSLRGGPAGVVAEILENWPESAEHFEGVGSDSRADARIRAVIRSAAQI